MLHSHLQLNTRTTAIRWTNGRSLGTFQKALLFRKSWGIAIKVLSPLYSYKAVPWPRRSVAALSPRRSWVSGDRCSCRTGVLSACSWAVYTEQMGDARASLGIFEQVWCFFGNRRATSDWSSSTALCHSLKGSVPVLPDAHSDTPTSPSPSCAIAPLWLISRGSNGYPLSLQKRTSANCAHKTSITPSFKWSRYLASDWLEGHLRKIQSVGGGVGGGRGMLGYFNCRERN